MRFDSSARHKNLIQYWLPVILWMAFIFWMSTGTFSLENTSLIIGPLLRFLFPSLSPQDLDLIHGLIRKAGHAVEYLILGLFLFRAFRGGASQAWRLRWSIYSFIWVVAYAASDEFHQSLVAERTASLIDVGIDSAGGILSQIIIALQRFRYWK